MKKYSVLFNNGIMDEIEAETKPEAYVKAGKIASERKTLVASILELDENGRVI